MKSRSLKSLVGALTASAALISGCGQMSSDPLEGERAYKDLARNSKPPTSVPQQKFQDFAVLGQVFPPPDTNGEVLAFVEGEKKSYSLKLRVLQGGVEYKIETQGLPEGANLRKVEGTDDEYLLSWRPEIGFSAGQDVRILKMKINLKVVRTADPRTAEVMKLANVSHEIPLVVARTRELPMIEKIEIATDVLQLGQKVEFLVYVKDLSLAPGEMPELWVGPDFGGTQDKPQVKDVTRYVSVQRVGRAEGGQFVFSGYFDSKGIEMPSKASELEARFTLVSVNSVRRSPIMSRVIRIQKQVQVEARSEGVNVPVAASAAGGTTP